MHLSDEQLETVLNGTQAHAGAVMLEDQSATHLASCEACQRRLREFELLRRRLKKAVQPVVASQDLRTRIAGQLRSTASAERIAMPRHVRWVRTRVVPFLATAAAILIIVVPLVIYFAQPSQAYADPSELVAIHQRNITDGHHFYTEDDPDKLAAFFREKLNFTPRMPSLGAGLAMRGCCITQFGGKAVGSYVVQTPGGPISIIVINEDPKSMPNLRQFRHKGHAYWSGHFADNNMVMARMDRYTYCAVGHTQVEKLTDLLSRLVK